MDKNTDNIIAIIITIIVAIIVIVLLVKFIGFIIDHKWLFLLLIAIVTGVILYFKNKN